MQAKLAIALGASVVAASVWMARLYATRQSQSGIPELDDDEAAELIARYRPALLSALAGE